MKEFAKGIPYPPTKKPLPETKAQIGVLNIQEHLAERAGKHYDIRLLIPPKKKILFSWAARKLPTDKKPILAVRQPDHTVDYLGWEGKIEEGYGKGRVKSILLTPIDIVSSHKDAVKFNIYEGRNVNEFLLFKTDKDKWLLKNITPKIPDLPDYKRSMPEKKDIPDEVLLSPKYMAQAKIDGAHVLVLLEPGKQIRVFSYRRAKKTGELLEHTYKIPELIGKKAPKGIKRMILRGEIFAVKKDKPLPVSALAGLLNQSIWKAREKVEKKGIQFRIALFDVHKIGNKKMELAPYKEKLPILEKATKLSDIFILPPRAQSPKEKRKLIELISKGKLPLTKEGIVFWNMEEKKPPFKYKFKNEYDVIIKGFFPAKGELKGLIGGFYYALPENPNKIVGKVGTGFTLEERKRLTKMKDKLIGEYARVEAAEQLPSGALRAPSFIALHLDMGWKRKKYSEAYELEPFLKDLFRRNILDYLVLKNYSSIL